MLHGSLSSDSSLGALSIEIRIHPTAVNASIQVGHKSRPFRATKTARIEMVSGAYSPTFVRLTAQPFNRPYNDQRYWPNVKVTHTLERTIALSAMPTPPPNEHNTSEIVHNSNVALADADDSVSRVLQRDAYSSDGSAPAVGALLPFRDRLAAHSEVPAVQRPRRQ